MDLRKMNHQRNLENYIMISLTIFYRKFEILSDFSFAVNL